MGIPEENFGKVAQLVALLKAATETDHLKWQVNRPAGCYVAVRRDFYYIVDNPRDGKPTLVANVIKVWEGAELRDLIRTIEAQQDRFYPKIVDLTLDPRIKEIPRILDEALASFATST